MGERGPERVTFGGNGRITPNKALGATITNNIHVDATSENADQIADKIAKQLDWLIGRSFDICIDGSSRLA